MLRFLIFSICSALLLLSSCKEQEPNYFVECYEKGRNKLIRNLFADFELQLNNNYSQNDFVKNIVLYLENLQSGNQNIII